MKSERLKKLDKEMRETIKNNPEIAKYMETIWKIEMREIAEKTARGEKC